MGFYLDNQGNYYEGDKADMGHQSVPQRPSPDYKWDGKWVLDDAVIKARQEEETKAMPPLVGVLPLLLPKSKPDAPE